MTIGILYVGIGRYIQFWDEFYTSCEKYFLPQAEKKYFVFTDHPLVAPPNVKVVFQEDLGWPGNTLFRFQMFLRQKEELEAFDFIYFFNGNTLFLDTISEKEIIPNESEGYLVALSWYIYDSVSNVKYPYERNHESTAYIPKGKGIHYYQGGLNGGRSKEYLELMERCNYQIIEDNKKGIVAISHDESHLNKYLLDKRIKVLNTEYGRPGQWSFPKKPKIIFRNKKAVLGKTFLRRLKEGEKQTLFGKLADALRNICKKKI